jgi:mono/diheme cytochrome c family protein
MTVASSARQMGSRVFASIGAARKTWIAALVFSVALLLLPLILKLDGKPHADWQQFVGRFHPAAVHVPIGLILLVPILEIAGAFRPALREAAAFVLALAAIACIGSLMLGYLLAYGSGTTGATVTRHMWGGIGLTIGVLLCLLSRPMWSMGSGPRVYPAVLGCVMIALLWTAHQGGSLTHGTGYLTEYMPAKLRRLTAFASAIPNPDSFYAQHIHPIFDSNCVGCHGASKSEGGLRLDSFESLMKGGKDGPVIIPRNADKSMLLERVTLPAGSPHLMPAEGRPPLKSNEIAWIRSWIRAGASATERDVAGVVVPAMPKDLPPEPVGDYSKFADEIARMRNSQGAKLLPVSSKPTDGLVLNTVDVAPNFGDAQLEQFEKYAPYIVELDLARTAVTDASFETLARFTHMRALHLEGTSVTGSGLGKLSGLLRLSYLNLSETKVTAASVGPLKSMPNLRHVYLFNTPAQPASAPDTNASTGGAR